MNEQEKYEIARDCPLCGDYGLRYNCNACKLDCCYDCWCKWHRERKIYNHVSWCILNNDWLVRLFEKSEEKD